MRVRVMYRKKGTQNWEATSVNIHLQGFIDCENTEKYIRDRIVILGVDTNNLDIEFNYTKEDAKKAISNNN
jgi:hypothetical protein